MSIFGGGFTRSQSYQQQPQTLGSMFPDARVRAACDELREAEKAYAAAEDRLIKARRVDNDAQREWRNFYYPQKNQG